MGRKAGRKWDARPHAGGVNESDAVTLTTIRAWCATGKARRIREEARLSQQEVADTIGAARHSVSRWESGDRLPRTDVALRYAALLLSIEAAQR